MLWSYRRRYQITVMHSIHLYMYAQTRCTTALCRLILCTSLPIYDVHTHRRSRIYSRCDYSVSRRMKHFFFKLRLRLHFFKRRLRFRRRVRGTHLRHTWWSMLFCFSPKKIPEQNNVFSNFRRSGFIELEKFKSSEAPTRISLTLSYPKNSLIFATKVTFWIVTTNVRN